MKPRFLIICAFVLFAINPVVRAQQPADTLTATCSYSDGNQISLRYNKVSEKEKISDGKVWAPGGSAMLLFTQVPVTVANVTIPVGAYGVYLVPQKHSWTLVINKGVGETSKYDMQQDLVRAEMESGQLPSPEKFNVQFGHIGEKQCTMRVYYQKIGAFTDFMEK